MKRKTLAIPLRTNDFSNSSQVVSLFTREEGLVDALAKGAHRPRNPFQGPFDLAVLYEVVYLERRAAGLWLLTEAVVVDGFRGVRRRWDRHVAASHLIEFLRHVATAGEPAPELFDLTCAAFAELGSARRSLEAVLSSFDVRALRVLGLFSPLLECVECRREWSGSDRPVFLSLRAGGLVCAPCRQRRRLPGVFIPGAAVRCLNRLAEPLPAGNGARVEPAAAGEGLEQDVRRLVHDLRTNLLERELLLLKCTTGWV